MKFCSFWLPVTVSGILFLSSISSAGETQPPEDCVGALTADETFKGSPEDAQVLCEGYSYDQIVCAMGLGSDDRFLAQAPQGQELFHSLQPEALRLCKQDSSIVMPN